MASSEDDGLSGRLLHTGEERAGHDGVGTGGQGLDDIARVADTAVGDDGDTGALQGLGGHHDCGKLGHAHTCNDTGGADGTGAYADLHGVHSALLQSLGCLTGSDVAGDDLQVGELLTDCLQDSQHTLRMTVGGVEDQSLLAVGLSLIFMMSL